MIFGREPERLVVETPDGVGISIKSWPSDQPEAQEILFIHGYSQSHLCWMPQIADQALARHSLIAYDLRGHGESAKPADPEYYRDSERWAGELATVIDVACTRRPIVVVWSYAGRVVMDYAKHHGTDKIAGIVLVSATTSGRPDCFGPGLAKLAEMHDDRLDRNVASVVNLWASCTKGTLDGELAQMMVASNMLTPPHVRRSMSGREADYEAICKSIGCPVLVIHGTEDPINTMAMAEYSRDTIPDAELIIYEKTGHAPFLERPHRFSSDLVTFAGRCVA